MKVFVTGANGQLGHDLLLELAGRGHEVCGSGSSACYSGVEDAAAALPYRSLDIRDAEAVESVLRELRPDAVLHCAAWTAVDRAEDEPEAARQVNAVGTENIARSCRELGCAMMYISTDYVFGGEGTEPWQPDDRAFDPRNVYGQTKLEGELAVRGNLKRFFIVRTAWVFGLSGSNFVKTMIRVGQNRNCVRVVCDQIGTPTYTRDLARLLADMIVTEQYGNYHATNEGGYISWYDFCREIYRQAGMSTEVIPVTTEEYGMSRAARPRNSRLDKAKLTDCGFDRLPDWRDALQRYLAEAKLLT